MTKLFALLTVSIAILNAPAFGAEESSLYPECTIKQPGKAEEKEARASFQQGQTAFGEKRYGEAADWFQRAYEKDCTASMLLYNAALALEKAERYKEALTTYQAFLDRSDAPDGSKEVLLSEQKIKLLAKMIKSEEEAAALKAQQSPKAAVAPLRSEPPSARSPETKGQTSTMPTILILGGGAIATIGTALYVSGALDESSTKAQCANYACPSDHWTEKGNSAQDRKTFGTILGLSGLATAGAGIIWILSSGTPNGHPHESEPPEGVRPWFAQKGGGISYQRAF